MDTLTQSIKDRLSGAALPRHIAIIMDGNGRWAKQRGLPRSAGHYEGVSSVRKATELCSDIGVGYLTLYAFSTENWNRPQEEVDILMNLIGMAIEQETPDLLRNNVRLRLVGDIERLPDEARSRLFRSRSILEGCTGLTLSLCLSYSSKSEITRAVRRLADMAVAGEIDPQSIAEETIADELYTYPTPDPDLIIRTGGEKRLSNFLLWQAAYSELYFSPVLWPDFGKEALADAIADYQMRERRFGLTSEQVEGDADAERQPI
ncbi:MAG: isoprenyl transferase [Muribaculaceae bacterium]|nr:isoprenyl transferase [Muribaculaceae bacterium]